MADFRNIDTQYYISSLKESSYNTGQTTGSNYLKALNNNAVFITPGFEFIDDAGKAGNGHEFATTQCITYVTHPAITFTDDVNSSYAGNLLLRAAGGTVTSAQQGGSAAYKHSAPLISPLTSLQLPSTTIAVLLGGASFRLDGMVIDKFSISQQAANRPQFSVDLVGSGKYVTPHGLTGLPTTVSNLTCLDGNQAVVSWTDTGGAQTFSGANCTLRGWSVELANNLVLNDRCPGDSTVTITDNSITTTPAYVSRLRIGTRTCTGSITITLDSTIPDWLTFGTNDVLTDVTFRAQGPIIASTFRHSIGIVMEKARIKSITPGEDNGLATLTINVQAFYDSAASTPVTVEVFNASTTMQ